MKSFSFPNGTFLSQSIALIFGVSFALAFSCGSAKFGNKNEKNKKISSQDNPPSDSGPIAPIQPINPNPNPDLDPTGNGDGTGDGTGDGNGTGNGSSNGGGNPVVNPTPGVIRNPGLGPITGPGNNPYMPSGPIGPGIPGQGPYLTIDVSPIRVPVRPYSGSLINFNAQCRDANSFQIAWYLGNGYTSAQPLFQYGYNEPGRYSVTSICTTGIGTQLVRTIQIEVYDPTLGNGIPSNIPGCIPFQGGLVDPRQNPNQLPNGGYCY